MRTELRPKFGAGGELGVEHTAFVKHKAAALEVRLPDFFKVFQDTALKLVDISQAAVDKGLATVSSSLDRLIKKEKITADDKAAAAGGRWMDDYRKGNKKPAFFRNPVHGLRGVQTALVQEAVGAVDAFDLFGGKTASLQSDGVHAFKGEGFLGHFDERWNVFAHQGAAPNHGVGPDVYKLMHGGESAQNGEFTNFNVAILPSAAISTK